MCKYSDHTHNIISAHIITQKYDALTQTNTNSHTHTYIFKINKNRKAEGFILFMKIQEIKKNVLFFGNYETILIWYYLYLKIEINFKIILKCLFNVLNKSDNFLL